MAPPVTFERGFDPDPMGSYLGSLAKVVDMAPRLVLPGHGEPFADGARRATAIADAKRRRLDRALSLVEAGDTTATDLTAAMFSPALTGFQLHFAMAEVLAYLAYHEARGAAERVRRSDGVFVWRAVPGTA
jgi:glyoxylase-like metal-dependent hydrolase (beta-lactamase superfamily II)